MLTDEQKELVKKGLQRGLMDTMIAERIGAKHIEVYKYRHELDISREDVLEARYDQWMKLLQSGKSLESIAKLYCVKPDTIINTLYRKRAFSYVEVKRQAENALAAQFRRVMGVSEKDTRDQRLLIWVALAKDGIDLDSIASMYKVKPATVKRALRGQVDLKHEEDESDVFDW